MSDETISTPPPTRRPRFLRAVRVIGLGSGALVTLAMVALVMLAGVAFILPSWLINDRSLAKVPSLATRAGVDLNWDRARLDASKPRLRTHHFAWDFGDVCLNVASIPFSFCADEVAGQLDLEWDFSSFPRIVRVGQLGVWHVDGGVIAAGPFAESTEPSTFDVNQIRVPWILEHAILEPSTFAFDQVSVTTPGGVLEGRISLTFRQDVSKAPFDRQFGRLLTVSVNQPGVFSPLCWRTSTPAAPFAPMATRQEDARGRCVSQLSAFAAIGARDGLVRLAQVGPVAVAASDVHLAFGGGSRSASAAHAAEVQPPYRIGYSAPTTWEIPPLLAESSLGKLSVDIRESSVDVDVGGIPWHVAGLLRITAAPPTGVTASGIDRLDVSVEAESLCVAIPYAKGCIETLAIGAAVGSANGAWEVQAVHRASADIAHLDLFLPAVPDEEGAPVVDSEVEASAPAFEWRSIPFEGRGPDRYHLRVNEFTLSQMKAEGQVAALAKGKVSLELATLADGRSEWRLESQVQPLFPRTNEPAVSRAGARPQPALAERLRTVKAHARATSGERPLQGPYGATIDAEGQFSTGERASLKFSGGQAQSGSLDGTLALSGSLPTGEALTLALNGREDSEKTVHLKGRVFAAGVKNLKPSSVAIAGAVSSHQAWLDLDGSARFGPGLARIALPSPSSTTSCLETPPPGPNLDLQEVGLKACSLRLEYSGGVALTKLAVSCGPSNLTRS